MAREDTMQIKHPRRDPESVDMAAETAALLFAHVEATGSVEQHTARARDIYDRIRSLAVQREVSGTMERARAATIAAPFKPGESGVSPKTPG